MKFKVCPPPPPQDSWMSGVSFYIKVIIPYWVNRVGVKRN